MLIDSFQTIAEPCEGTYKEKGSKFLSYAYPVSEEEEIKLILSKIRKEHFSARHCCFAWSLGIEHEKYRVNDDGEPSGTAGRPIFGQIQSHKLTNILLVVVRYFGGTLLGASGLIRAYREAASLAIQKENIITKNIEATIEVQFGLEAMNNMMLMVKEEQMEITSSTYEKAYIYTLRIRLSKVETILAKLEMMAGIIKWEIAKS